MIHQSPNLLVAAAMTFMPVPAVANTNSIAFEPAQEACRHFDQGNIPLGDAAETTVAARFAAIAKLSRGWDGDDAKPVSSSAIRHAKQLVDFALGLPGTNGVPAIVPCADGSIQIEWHQRDSRFEMYFEIDGSTSAWWHDRNSDHEIEADGPDAAVLLGQWAVRDAAWSALAIAA